MPIFKYHRNMISKFCKYVPIHNKKYHKKLYIKTYGFLFPSYFPAEICFAEVYTLPRDPTEEDYDKAIDALMRHQLAKVVIVFLNEDKVKYVFVFLLLLFI